MSLLHLQAAGGAQASEGANLPRLVYFQYRYDERLPEFLLIHMQEHVRCLSHFFDVRVINEDCDYLEVCEKHQPALALFELGVNHETCRRPNVANVHANPHIPKAAVHHADAWCNARGGFLADLTRHGIETVFSISTTAGEHTPVLADSLFYWPVFVDADVFRDYGMWKSIPVLLTGNTNALYPWRHKIFRLIRDRFPTMTCPHGGYGPQSSPAAALVGERYARTINASWCVPSCGTVAKEVVRKHFEVPASKACLITERSAGLAMAGFEDMRSCLFVDDSDVVDKLAWLLSNEGEIQKIITAGHELVHTRHTSQHRNQIRQWFDLHRSLTPSEKIVQLNPFDAPVVARRSSHVSTAHVAGGGSHLQLIAEGDAALRRNDYVGAEQLYLRALNFMPWMPEPRLRLALVNLYKGRAADAEARLEPLLQFVLFKFRAEEPDPVEWAYYVAAALCRGRVGQALERAKQFTSLNHTELARIRWACAVLGGGPAPAPLADTERRSVHRLPERSLVEWAEQLAIMLRASGRGGMADTLVTAARKASGEASPHSADVAPKAADSSVEARAASRPLRSLRRRMVARELKVKVRKVLSSALHGAERKFGYFLPYGLSSVKNDALIAEISRELQPEGLSFALLIGAAKGSRVTEAFFSGLRRNAARPKAFCILAEETRLSWSHTEGGIKLYPVSAASGSALVKVIDERVQALMREHAPAGRALVVVDGDAWKAFDLREGLRSAELSRARAIILSGTDSVFVQETLQDLQTSSVFDVHASDAVQHGGYAVLRPGKGIELPHLSRAS